MEAHTDRNEGNFGQFSQQLRREPNARLQTVTSKVAMRANDTVEETRKNVLLAGYVGKTRKMERIESDVSIRQQLSELSKQNEPHLQQIRETVARRKEKRRDKCESISAQVTKDGELRHEKEADRLMQKYTKQTELKDVLKKHINHFKANNPDVASENKEIFQFSKEKKTLNSKELLQSLKTIISLVKSGPSDLSSESDDEQSGDEEQVIIEKDKVSDCNDSDSDEDDVENVELPPARFSPGDGDCCIVVGFVDRWYPGYITKVIGEDTAMVNFLHPAKTGLECTAFRWPRHKDESEVSIKAVISMDVELVPQGSSLRLWELSNVKKINNAFRN